VGGGLSLVKFEAWAESVKLGAVAPEARAARMVARAKEHGDDGDSPLALSLPFRLGLFSAGAAASPAEATGTLVFMSGGRRCGGSVAERGD